MSLSLGVLGVVQLHFDARVESVHGRADATRGNAHEAVQGASGALHRRQAARRNKRLVSYGRVVKAGSRVLRRLISLVPDETAGAMLGRYHKTSRRRGTLVMNLRRGLLTAPKPAVQMT